MSSRAHILPELNLGVTPKQQVTLARIIEEAAEVQKAATKALRFGFFAVDGSVDPPVKYNNGEDLFRELKDLNDASVELWNDLKARRLIK